MRIIFSIIFVASITLSAHAQQDSSGVYMTSDDFQNQELAFAINCKIQKHKIKLKEFFSRPFIVVVHNDTSYTLPKNEVYGYRDCDGASYRFVTEKVYKILNPFDPIVIYRYFVYTPKNPVVDYFFSKGNSGLVEELTKANLKRAFPDNQKFHDLLDLSFKDELDLSSYDRRKKRYKLITVYTKGIE